MSGDTSPLGGQLRHIPRYLSVPSASPLPCPRSCPAADVTLRRVIPASNRRTSACPARGRVSQDGSSSQSCWAGWGRLTLCHWADRVTLTCSAARLASAGAAARSAAGRSTAKVPASAGQSAELERRAAARLAAMWVRVGAAVAA